MTITRAEERDLEQILAIQQAAYAAEAALYNDFLIPPLRQTLGEMHSEFQTKVFLKAVVGGLLVGSVRTLLDGETCHIGRLIVDPAAQGRGLGSDLLSAAEGVYPEARVAELFTGSKSLKNLGFYEKRGYRRVREEVVSPNLTLVHLRKPLSGGA